MNMKTMIAAAAALTASAVFAALGSASESAILKRSDIDPNKDDPRLPLADPFVFVEKGTNYCYGTLDEDGIAVAVSTDLVHWRNYAGRAAKGLALHKDDVYGNREFWAPEVHRRKDGKYVMFFSSERKCCTAVADGPLGPFTQAERRPLFPEKQGVNIDSTLVEDDDGTPWMYYSRGSIRRVRMTDDLLSVDPSTDEHVRFPGREPWEKVAGDILEGPSVVKVGGTWYLLYSANDCRSQDYSVGCLIADQLAGPWRRPAKSGPVINRIGGLTGTGHGAPFRGADGRWRYVFHAHSTPKYFEPRKTYLTDIAFGETVTADSQVTTMVMDGAARLFSK